jgi:hypothetical protein
MLTGADHEEIDARTFAEWEVDSLKCTLTITLGSVNF